MCSGVEGSTQPCVAWDPIDDLWYQAPNPCARSGRALDPGVYQAAGEAAQSNFVKDLSNLYQFRAGGRFDAQPLGGSPSYANYVYGVYTAAAGYTLDQALAGADIYAQYRSRYPAGTPMDSPDHPFTPAPNVRNITAGFNSEQNGTLCHKQQ